MESVLIAEDSPEIAKLMDLTLRIEGYQILQAFDGTQALELARAHHPDLILLDVMMPGLNGFEVAQELKRHSDTADIPIIFVTAKHELDALVQGLEIAVDYISKPFAVPELAARVRAAMRMRKVHEDLKLRNEKLAMLLFQAQGERAEEARAESERTEEARTEEARDKEARDKEARAEEARSTNTTFDEKSLIRGFSFPEEVRSSCEQYLLYFVQFLKDVGGVEARASLQHESGESGQVLFSVTPEVGKVALEKVHRALDIYLQLPRRPVTTPDFSAPIEVQRLEAQILFLQGQWRLSEATIQAKDATIEAKDATIAQLKAGTVFEYAQQNSSLKKDEQRKISLFGGVVKLKSYDAKAVDIDLPALYEHMKRWFIVDETEIESKQILSPFSPEAMALPPWSQDVSENGD